ncbi:MAG: exopolysaccharide biosynthesis polyprenyl glycosylphosphotransferase [Clostridiales bacterium]|jgi:exopolysaccharide biosynthesis polyprenyl glycosylphosphotransferase|nr:exopolysaccharide biosynthesis polyprenyl glycosylphosphotransferase [Clostridiales bacterium]
MNNQLVKSNLLRILIAAIDAVLTGTGIVIACFITAGPEMDLRANAIVFVLGMLATIVIFDVYGLYKVPQRTAMEMNFTIFISIAVITLITATAAFLIRGGLFPRGAIAVSPVIQFLLVASWRYSVWRVTKKYHEIRKVIIIGSLIEARKTANKIFTCLPEFYNITFVDSEAAREEIIGHVEHFDEVFVCAGTRAGLKSEIISKCISSRKYVHLVPDFYDILISQAAFSQYDDLPVFSIEPFGLTIEQRIIKRGFDLFVSLIGLTLSLPIMLIAAILIKIDSEGPVFYFQERVTIKNRKFRVIKFRTMIAGAEDTTGPILASKGDFRITRVGRLLRSTRFDELPQLLNVLKGDMSFVGPRPEREFFISKYKNEIPHYDNRHAVKGGITGFAQVRGKYTTTATDKLKFDLMYIKSYSLLQDIKILLQTIKAIFMKDKSIGLDPMRKKVR